MVQNSIDTGGGAVVQGPAGAGENFIGRDNNVTINVYPTDPEELLQAVLSLSLRTRGEQWKQEIGKAISEFLNQTDGTLEQLQQNDPFIDTLLQASQFALKTSVKEKHESLRNAVINSAFSDAPDESLRQIFLNLVDQLTLWHLRFLKLFSDPKGVASQYGVSLPQKNSVYSPSDVFMAIYPEIGKLGPIYWNHLSGHQLVVKISGSDPKTTELGEQFLSFIENRL